MVNGNNSHKKIIKNAPLYSWIKIGLIKMWLQLPEWFARMICKSSKSSVAQGK